VPHAEQEMLILPENLITPLVFIEVRVVLSLFWILSFDCSICLIVWYLYIFYFQKLNMLAKNPFFLKISTEYYPFQI